MSAKAGQRGSRARPETVSPSRTTPVSRTYATTPAARAVYQSMWLGGHAQAPSRSTLRSQESFATTAPPATNRAATPRSSSQDGPFAPSRKPGLRGHVGGEAVAPDGGHSRPGGGRRAPRAGVDQMVLRLAAAQPVPGAGAARGHAAVLERDRAAAREADDHRLAVRGDVAARGDEAGLVEQRRGIVDRHRLDDAVQVERGAGGPDEQARARPERTPVGGRGRGRERPVGRERRRGRRRSRRPRSRRRASGR